MTDSYDLETLFERIRTGDERARDELFQCVYDELHRLARKSMGQQSPGHTLQPTALVNEVYLRLDKNLGKVRDRGHFVSVAARAMRQILVDHHRRKVSEKRSRRDGAGELDILVSEFDDRALDLMQLDSALTCLEEKDPGLAQLVEIHFFGGQPAHECARLMNLSERQVFRRLDSAKVFLRREMRP